MNLKKVLEDLMTTVSTGVANTQNAVGTRRKRTGNSPDSFITDVPGKKKKKGKKENLAFHLQQRKLPEPYQGSGKYINVPQWEEKEGKMSRLLKYLETVSVNRTKKAILNELVAEGIEINEQIEGMVNDYVYGKFVADVTKQKGADRPEVGKAEMSPNLYKVMKIMGRFPVNIKDGENAISDKSGQDVKEFNI